MLLRGSDMYIAGADATRMTSNAQDQRRARGNADNKSKENRPLYIDVGRASRGLI
jgi:hypothetical protein